MPDTSLCSANPMGHPPGPGTDYVRDLESVGLALHNWRTGAKDPDDCLVATSPLVYRSWSDQTMGIFGTDTGSSSVEIEAEATEDLLAAGIQLGDEDPVFRLGSSPFSGQGLDIFCLPRGSRLQLSTSQKGLRSVALLIHIDALPSTCNAVDREFPSIVRKIRCERAPFSSRVSLPVLLRRTALEVIDDSPAPALQRLYRRAKMAELLWLVMDHLRRAELEHDCGEVISARAREGIERVRRFIEEDPTRRATTEQLGRLAGMNRTTLRSHFKRIHGLTMFEYRQALIMRSADEMLRDPNLAISEIGYRFGYRQPSSFNVAYRRFYRHAPGKARRLR